MSKHTLTLVGSTAALAAAMAAFDRAENGTSATDDADYQRAGNAQSPSAASPTPSTSTGTGTAAPTPLPSAPSSAVPMPPAPIPLTAPISTDSDEDDDASGGASDGSGLDAEGLPWDERIHTSTKTKSGKGVWTKRRGGPKGAELAAIEAELRAGQGAPAPGEQPAAVAPPPPPMASPAPMPIAAPEPVATVAPPAPMPMPAPAEQPAAVAPPPPMPVAAPEPVAPPAPMPTEQPASDDPADFPTFMQQVGPKMGEAEGQINSAYLAAVCQLHGLNSITDLALKPEMIPAIVAQFRVDNRW